MDHGHHQRDTPHAHHHDHAGEGHAHGETDEAGLAEILDLDGEVLHAYLDDVVGWVAGATGPDVQRVVDLGAGTGTGTLALARRFPAAQVVAVDASATMLSRLSAAATDADLGDRVRTVCADLDAGWPGLADLDLAWAALSLHHVADPGRLLGQVHDALRPGGLLAVTEMTSASRFLPDDLGVGRPGLELRCHAALDAQPAPFDRYPDWDEALERAGFVTVERRTFSVTPPQPEPATARYARSYLSRLRPRLADDLAADDLATLDLLLDDTSPHGLLRRGDLRVQGSRTGWLARRV
ncbi:class I SAM-dependent methyltransferase [Friedmanniella luteola]|nr:class I SAM-dependent methyltransferase [Friedmanniella luteola]